MTNFNINFKAKFVQPVKIKRLEGKVYKPQKISLVELNKEDIPAMYKLYRHWNADYAYNIYNNLVDMGNFKKCDTTNIYALTTQKGDYKNIQYKKILGLIDLFTNQFADFTEVNYLQVRPKYIYSYYDKNSFIDKLFVRLFKGKRKYKNIGKSLLCSVQKIYPNKEIQLHSVYDAINFYQKLGFQFVSKGSNLMVLNKKI